jgi:hypothetical protein
MTDKEALAWEVEHDQDYYYDLAARLAFERARNEALVRAYIRALEHLLAALQAAPHGEVPRA